MTISNYKLDVLCKALIENIVVRKNDPFEQISVVCQGKSMEQYVNKTIADQKTIAANINYRFPRNSINDILNLYQNNGNVTRLDSEVMIWDIYFLLPELISNPLYKPLDDYINADNSSTEFRQYQLARQIAGVFDDYIAYRGDWLELWQKNERVFQTNGLKQKLDLGGHELWQADLWRKLTVERSDNEEENISFKCVSRILKECIDEIPDKLPKKISLFAVANLPQDYIEFYKILKSKVELDFYYIMPCVEYWGDLTRAKAMIENDGNRLLASWGTVGRDFFNSLLDADFDLSKPDFISENEENPASLLSALQYDISRNCLINESKFKNTDISNWIKDETIVINSCYSRMREIEILYDYILHELNQNNCEFSDLLVMAPNIEDYAPYIKAIFKQNSITNSQDTESKYFIPFSISDCSSIFSSIEAEIFVKILKLPNSRFTSEDIFDIISSEPVANKFKFSKDDIEKMYDLISNANISWGKNQENREKILDTEYHDLGSWLFGFKRMLMGYAFDSESTVGDNILPLSINNSDKGIVIGKLISVCNKLFGICDKMTNSYSYDDWCNKIFYPVINELFELTDKKNEQINPLSTAISSFKKSCSKAIDNEKTFPLDVAKSAIENELNNDSQNFTSFFRGGVTFCQLLPMRNIPFKNVCIIGMNDSEFPRINSKCGFNLAEKEYRAGDRNLKNDDRYIFLESLLAAKDKLYISYIGQSNSTNEEIPPSVLIDELLDYLELTTGKERAEFITKHPLHGFDDKYFSKSDNQLYSYSKPYCNAAQSYISPNKNLIGKLFSTKNLSLPDENMKNEFSFDEFIKFFLCPAKFFLKYRFNITLYDETLKPLETSEPFELDNLKAYNLKDELLGHKIDKKEFEIINNYKSSGDIPAGVWGDDKIEEADGIAEQIKSAVQNLGKKCPKTKEYKLKFESQGFNFTLTGEFDNIFENNGEKVQLFFRPSSIKNKDKLKAYIWHQLAIETGLDIQKAVLVGWDKKLLMENISAGNELFTTLKDIFVRGLRKPLPLFENSSPEFAKKYKKEMDEEEIDNALKTASQKWDKGYNDYGYDLEEYANLICFGESPPQLSEGLKDEFMELAKSIYKTIDIAFVKGEGK